MLPLAAAGLVLEPRSRVIDDNCSIGAWKDEACRLNATCNSIERKQPAVPAEPVRFLGGPSGAALGAEQNTDAVSIEHFFGNSEASAYGAARRTFEHLLAHGLQELEWVQDIVRLFAARLVAFLLKAHAEHGDADAGAGPEAAYLLAFVGRPERAAANQRGGLDDFKRIAGHPGPHADRLARVMGNGSVDSVRGNLREVLGAVYAPRRVHGSRARPPPWPLLLCAGLLLGTRTPSIVVSPRQAMTLPHNNYASTLLGRVVARERWEVDYAALLNAAFVRERRDDLVAFAPVTGAPPRRAAPSALTRSTAVNLPLVQPDAAVSCHRHHRLSCIGVRSSRLPDLVRPRHALLLLPAF